MSLIDDIKERLRIEEIVGRTVPLTRSGQHLRGLCPFHSEKTPSFYVFEDSQRFKCFGCGAGGDLVDFVMQYEGWNMQSTLQELAREAHIELQPLSPQEQRALELTREKETIFALAAEWFHAQLGAWDSKVSSFPQEGAISEGLAYARKRGFTDETIRSAALGWFGIVIMTLATQYGVTHMPVHRSAVIMLFELVAGAVSAGLLTEEVVHPLEWLGGALIIAAAYWAARLPHEQTP